MVCPYCKSAKKIRKNGCYKRGSDGKKCQRFLCSHCKRSFSETHFGIDFRLRKRHINQGVFRCLCSGVSQRRSAILFNVHRQAIARRLIRFGSVAKHNLQTYRKSREKVTQLDFDELESFETTKCKPLTAAIAVEDKTRKILAISVGQIPAKGPLAAIARKKYGPRTCQRKKCLKEMFEDLKQCLAIKGIVKTDKSQHYPPLIRLYLKDWQHEATLGRRGCIVGQGELKEGGWDPLFSLNHTYAMIRDGLKRLSRRTWCTTKKADNLNLALHMYAWFHNLYLDSKKRKDIVLTWIT